MKLNQILSSFFFICAIGGYSLFAAEKATTYSLNLGYALVTEPTDSLAIIKKQIGAFAKKKEYNKAILYSKKLLDQAQKLADSSTIANAYWRQGFYFKKINQLDSAFYYFNQAYILNLSINDSIAIGDRLLDMSNIQKSLGDFNGGMITAIDGLRYVEPTNEVASIIGLHQTISVSQKELGNYNEALRWNEKIFTLLKKKPTSKIPESSRYIIMTTRANILASQKKYQESLLILDSIANKTLGKNDLEYARAICNKGHFMWLENASNAESEALLLASLAIREKQNSATGLISSTIHLAEFYFNKDKKKALSYAEQAFDNALKIKNDVALLEALDLMLPLKHALGVDATTDAILYSKTQNDLEKTKQSIRAIYAATKYDNEQLEKENLKLGAEIAIREKQTIIAFSSAAFTLCLIGFIVYYKNQQKKRERLEQGYKTELRLAKKIHDELGNDIHYLMAKIEQEDESNASVKNTTLLQNLDHIYRRIRDISKEFTPINTGDSYGDDFAALIKSYGSNTTKIITKELPLDFWNAVPKQTKIELFRVVQELLTNMKKHSQASFVAITCTKQKNVYTVKYVDNGVGFNSNEHSFGLGLKNAENRMQAIRGNIIFEPKPSEGVSATITFSI